MILLFWHRHPTKINVIITWFAPKKNNSKLALSFHHFSIKNQPERIT